jgi:hypothetical protein
MRKFAIISLAVVVLLFVAEALWARLERRQSLTCLVTSSCLPSYNNRHVCRSLSTGLTTYELIYKLGEPTGRSNSGLVFDPGGGEPGSIQVELDGNGNARHIDCNGTAPNKSFKPTPHRGVGHVPTLR